MWQVQDDNYKEPESTLTTASGYMEHHWQLCPKCAGQGLISKPPWIAGDVLTWCSSTSAAYQCDVCNGKKIISSINGLPPA